MLLKIFMTEHFDINVDDFSTKKIPNGSDPEHRESHSYAFAFDHWVSGAERLLGPQTMTLGRKQNNEGMESDLNTGGEVREKLVSVYSCRHQDEPQAPVSEQNRKRIK